MVQWVKTWADGESLKFHKKGNGKLYNLYYPLLYVWIVIKRKRLSSNKKRIINSCPH